MIRYEALCAGHGVESTEDGGVVRFMCVQSLRITWGKSASVKYITISGHD